MSSKFKHLTLDDRITIEKHLSLGDSLSTISIILQKDPTTISKEIKLNRTFKERNYYGRTKSFYCLNYEDCNRLQVCGYKDCLNSCKKCKSSCTEYCKDYRAKQCSVLTKFPHVCNACDDKKNCRQSKYYYNSSTAQRNYRERLVLTREGINMTKDELDYLDNIVSPLIKKGQSIYHILCSHRDEIKLSAKTLYSLVDKGYLNAKNIDLTRKMTYKPRKKYKVRKTREELKIYINRKYEDFCAYMNENQDLHAVQIDLVESDKGGRFILTIHFVNLHFMIGILLENKKPTSVLEAFDNLEKKLGLDNFKFLFPVILTDRGTEFIRADELETSINLHDQRTKIFYCDSYSSYQKGAIEKNHVHLRQILPRGTSFDRLTQDKLNLSFSHINSYIRKSIKSSTAYQLAINWFGKEIIDALGIVEIDSDDVTLKPHLLK